MNCVCEPIRNVATKAWQAAPESVRTGGSLVPIAAKADNSASIEAWYGSALPGAGRQVTLNFGGVLELKLEQGVIDTLIENGGATCVDGGRVLLTARAVDDLVSTVINNGLIQA